MNGGIQRPDPLATVAEHWGDAAPEWVTALARACAETSASAVARRLGVSTSTLSEVLRRKYAGRVDRVADTAAALFLAAEVQCPVLGRIGRAACLEHQRRVASGVRSSGVRVRLAAECPACPQRRR